MRPLLNYSDGNLDADPRDAPAPERRARPRRRRRALRRDLRRAASTTFMLTHWARDRDRGEQLPLELVVHKMTRDTAALYGLGDRGVVAPGLRADVNVIDFDALPLRAARAGPRPARRRAPARPARRRLPRDDRRRRGDHARRRGHRRPSRQARAGHAMSARTCVRATSCWRRPSAAQRVDRGEDPGGALHVARVLRARDDRRVADARGSSRAPSTTSRSPATGTSTASGRSRC